MYRIQYSIYKYRIFKIKKIGIFRKCDEETNRLLEGIEPPTSCLQSTTSALLLSYNLNEFNCVLTTVVYIMHTLIVTNFFKYFSFFLNIKFNKHNVSLNENQPPPKLKYQIYKNIKTNFF